MQLLTIILLILTLSVCVINIIVLRWIIKDINKKYDTLDTKLSIVHEYLSSTIYTEGEKTRQYLKAEIIKSENDYVYYEPAEETQDS